MGNITNNNTVETPTVSKELRYNTIHTDYRFQRNVINKTTNFYSTTLFYIPKKNNAELEIQSLNTIVADLENQIKSISNSNQPPDGDGEIDTKFTP